MKGIELAVAANQQDVTVNVTPAVLDAAIDAKTLTLLFNSSEFAAYFLHDSAVFNLCDTIKDALENKQTSPFHGIIASTKDAQVEVSIAADKMSAQLTLVSAYMGKTPSVDDIYAVLKQHDITKGIGRKRVQTLIESACENPPGNHISGIIAKGLVARVGRNSKIKPLVACAMDRVLAPKYAQNEKIDMRDFGDILCVKKNDAIACRIPPTQGRNGFTVTGKVLPSTPGKWIDIGLGENAFIDSGDDNLVRAKLNGLPKVTCSKVNVENVYTLKGVNIATGNVNFDGCVIVNGDVAEKMRITANGDVTINGFVESASIDAGGDIVIIQGASGKLESLDCTFKAKGSIYIGHAQGVSIDAKKDLVIDKQLAYSHIRCSGNITIGKPANPQGKLFASTIICLKSIRAGHVGAISGSSLLINYTDMYNDMANKHTKLNAVYDKLASKNADHEIAIAKINRHKPSKSLSQKISLMHDELILERELLTWLRVNLKQSQATIENFANQATINASNTLHAGVSVSLNNKHWMSKQEYPACSAFLRDGQWVCTST